MEIIHCINLSSFLFIVCWSSLSFLHRQNVRRCQLPPSPPALTTITIIINVMIYSTRDLPLWPCISVSVCRHPHHHYLYLCHSHTQGYSTYIPTKITSLVYPRENKGHVGKGLGLSLKCSIVRPRSWI